MSELGQLETFPALSRMSAAGGEADVFRQKADFGTRMSAVGGKADVPATCPGSPLLANKRHSLVSKTGPLKGRNRPESVIQVHQY